MRIRARDSAKRRAEMCARYADNLQAARGLSARRALPFAGIARTHARTDYTLRFCSHGDGALNELIRRDRETL